MSPNLEATPKNSAAAESPSLEQAIHIDPDGDLLLCVGSELGTPLNIRVCSATMRRASPVWKSMLFGPWNESKPAHGDWVVSLPEDKTWATRILLSIVHGNFGDFPKEVEIVQLYDIAMLADRYALLRVLWPWVDQWLESARIKEQMTGQERLMRVHAAWQLGDDELLAASIRDLICGMAVGSTDEGRTRV
ncbi:uncharacterized protein B0T15DRAFT_254947 [Chaetomium strumarium]|uniref:BTB domain-containing protein n=1 Tax=Chaetomium strumarium TaxID=1170767 RepID=A0AAJ0M0V8_9PEZI|nr:hypothetical protein B0T15DRAFT_254947 [Chaetomium strumarium]